MKKFILWDNDGVLVDTEKYYLKANQVVLTELDIHLTVEQFKSISLDAGKSVLDLARDQGLADRDILNLRNKRDKVYEEFIFDENLALPNVGKVLEELHGKIGMAVVTSTKRKYFERLHKQTGLREYFQFVVAREDYKTAKPDPEPYLIGIAESGLDKSEIIAIEDTPRGIASATSAGISCIAIPNKFTRGADFKGAAVVCESIKDITMELLKTV